MDLRLARQTKRLTQTELSEYTSIKQSRLSLAENGFVKLTSNEKDEIHFVLGGEINWKETENQDNDGYDMAMPKVIAGKPKEGIMIRKDKLTGLGGVVLWAGTPKDTEKYVYETVKDGRK